MGNDGGSSAKQALRLATSAYHIKAIGRLSQSIVSLLLSSGITVPGLFDAFCLQLMQ